jgi:hypothetical protein
MQEATVCVAYFAGSKSAAPATSGEIISFIISSRRLFVKESRRIFRFNQIKNAASSEKMSK